MAAHSVTFLSDPARFAEQERRYLEVRKKEGMVWSDELVRQLPDLPPGHPLARLWRWRRTSLKRLIAFLKKEYGDQKIQVLDLGCGNGWMSNRIAQQLNVEVMAADVNRFELEQGDRLFGSDQLRFIFADVLEGVLPEDYFDVVVLAGSFQYFPNPEKVLAALKRILKSSGSIHIIDTNFYRNETQRGSAQAATRSYYDAMGVPEMAAHFHHYLYSDAGGENLNAGLWIRFLEKIKVLSPFPWIRISR